MFRLLVSGSRYWVNQERVLEELGEVLKEHGTEVTLVSGHSARGADKICENVALIFGWNVELHPAEWNTVDLSKTVRINQFGKPYNPSAGTTRNQKMVDLGADLLIAFQTEGESEDTGTAFTISSAFCAGIPTKVVTNA